MAQDPIEMRSISAKSGREAPTSSHRTSRTKSDFDGHGAALANRMGRPASGLKRSFGSLSILALSITLLASWESIANGFTAGLHNGGPVSLVWGLLLSIAGNLALAMSLAEMASICPIPGAQYHWTALFAPQKYKKLLTWMQGWVTVFAWQAGVSSIFFTIASQIQGLVIFNYDSYNPQRWHATLLMWAVLVLTFAINVYGIRILPVIQLVGGVFHVVFFVMLVVPLVLLAPRSTPDFVFTGVVNDGGYTSYGLSWCIGLLTVTYAFLGFDGAVHMSEEVRNAATVIPQILVQTILINGFLSLVFMLVLLFFIGDVNAALNSNTNFPIIQIFFTATGSKHAATAMMSLITITGLTASIGVVASVSRLTWAFARDGGLPFSNFFAKIDTKHHVPFRAIGLVSVTTVILSLINIGSTTALTAMFALTTSSLYISYIIPVILLVMKRISDPLSISYGPWTLGRWGMPINVFAISFGLFTIFFVPWPTQIPVTLENMNYCAPVFGILMILLGFDWLLRGRAHFRGPLKELLDPAPERRDS